MDNLKQAGVKAFAWDFVGRIAGQVVSFIVSIFLARLLSPSDFGLLAMVNVIIVISGSFTDMGLGVSLIQRNEVTEKHYGTVFFFNMATGLFFTLLLFLSSGLIAGFYKSPSVGAIASVMSLSFIISSFGNVIRVKLRRELSYAIPVQASLLGAGISGIIGISMAFNGYGVWSLVVQSLLNPLLTNIWIFYRVKWRPKLIYSLQALKELWSFGFKMFLSNLLEVIFTNLDSLIIGKIFSAGSLGYYFRAKSLNNFVINNTCGSLMSVLFPVISKLQNDKERLIEVVFKSFHLLNLFAFFIAGLFYVTSHDLIILVFSEKWLPSVVYFKIMLLSGYSYPLSALLVNIVSGGGNSKDFLILSIIHRSFFIFIFIVGFMYGIEGYLYGITIYSFIGMGVNIYYASKQLNIKMYSFIKIILPYFFLTAFLMFGVEWFFSHFSIRIYFNILLTGIIFSFFFLISVWALRLHGWELGLVEIKKLKYYVQNKFHRV